MEIKEVLDKNLICVLNSGSKEKAILELIGLLEKTGRMKDTKELKKNIFHREKLMSTGIGLGLAVPHTRMEGVRKPVIVAGVSPSGIRDYESIDGEEVRIIMLIICGRKQHREYISLLSNIVQKLKDDKKRQELVSAASAEKVFNILLRD